MNILKLFRSHHYSFLIKLFSIKKDSSLVPLYFFGISRINIGKSVKVIESITLLLQNEKYATELKRIKKCVKSIIFTDIQSNGSTWSKSQDIVILLGHEYSESLLYTIGIIIWFSSCLEMWEENKNLNVAKLHKRGFVEVLLFFDNLDLETHDIECYFKESYPSYIQR